MEIDALSVLVLFVVILVGFFLKQFWISVIFGVLLFLVIVFGRSPAGAGAGAARAGAAGPNVRPIIVKRRYVGEPSLFPGKMDIMLADIYPDEWWEYGPEAVGKGVGRAGGRIKRLLFGKGD